MEDVDWEALLATFVDEADQEIATLEQTLLTLEASPSQEIVDSIFRAAHTLRGNADALGYPSMSDCALALEDALNEMRQGRLVPSAGLVTLMLAAVDSLRSMLGAVVAGDEPQAADPALLRGITTYGAGAPPPPLPVESLPREAAAPVRKTLRVDVEKLDSIMTLTGELAIIRGKLRQALDRGDLRAALAAHLEADRLQSQMQEEVMRVRLVPFGPILQRYTRVARDAAAAHGKQVRVVIEGADVEVDNTIVERLRDPLMHMVRNAVDHAIEPPDERRAGGKDPVGTITLRAEHAAGHVAVTVCDDGAGLDRERIAARALKTGLIATADGLSDSQVFELVFAPGFTTAEGVSDLSGRGVGMDVVMTNVSALHGTVTIASQRGRGSTIRMRVPLTLAIIEGFAVGAAEETYVIPLDSVVECIELPPDRPRHADGSGVVSRRGEALPYVHLRALFELEGPPPRREQIVVIEHDGRHAGIAVDVLKGDRQAVVKPLAKLFRGVRGVAGSTILGSGRVALILDVPALLEEAIQRQPAAAP